MNSWDSNSQQDNNCEIIKHSKLTVSYKLILFYPIVSYSVVYNTSLRPLQLGLAVLHLEFKFPFSRRRRRRRRLRSVRGSSSGMSAYLIIRRSIDIRLHLLSTLLFSVCNWWPAAAVHTAFSFNSLTHHWKMSSADRIVIIELIPSFLPSFPSFLFEWLRWETN